LSEENKIIKKLLEESETESKEMSIIKDKRQYSIRIPKEFAETINKNIGNLENFKFKFILEVPSLTSNKKPKLSGELVYARN